MPQGTIKDFEGEERIGSLLMDDRTEVAIDAVSVEGSGLRTLRIGHSRRWEGCPSPSPSSIRASQTKRSSAGYPRRSVSA